MELQVQKRELFKKGVKALRVKGLIPAELYGHSVENLHLSVPIKEFTKVFNEAGENTVVNVKIDNETRPALIHDVDKDPITGKVRHVDFYQVKMDEEIKTMVPIEFVGEAPAVKDKSGVLVKAIQEIEVEALPGDLPHEIEADISGLDAIGKSIHISDIKIPDKVKIFLEPDAVIATITDLAPEEVEETPVSVEDVEVEGAEEVEARRAEKEQKEDVAEKEEKKESKQEGKETKEGKK